MSTPTLRLAIVGLTFLGALGAAGCAREPAETAEVADEPASGADAAAEAAAPAPAVASASDKPVAPVQESADAATGAEDAPSKSDASLERLAQLPAQDQLPAGKWQVGKNYKPIVPAQPTNVGPGKVEVIEVFWYGCNHCYALDPFLESWKANKPAYVEFVRLPVMWGPAHKSHARFYYTLQALGRDKDLHAKAFDTIHRGNNPLLGNDEESSYRAQLAFAKANGVDEKKFAETYRSMFVDTKLRQAEDLTKRYRVEGVPLMVVNGKYSTDVGSAGGHSQLITLLNDLAASEKRR
ncbi:MAG: thiol:disulfide interchange protein DsbA/DsbL [Steroidobacteraceae bacterium]|jgi:thiol:disulfide interchange protein DsbA|nr:thiol:disulfide interchange protein DsbA/DsbL [Steroidobacteraceae bacterium]